MIVAFDLDDTLYDESNYVRGGLAAVAEYGAARFGWPAETSLAALAALLSRDGRGRVFDTWLAARGVTARAEVRRCVDVYRAHRPQLAPWPAAVAALDALAVRGHALYLVTDGHKGVQARKLEALGLAPRFRRVFITHRFGLRHAKPSTHCFELIRRAEGCPWNRLAYVGDNPAKDFVGLNPLGALTVRVLTGAHRDTVAAAGYEARHRIPSLDAVPTLIEAHERQG